MTEKKKKDGRGGYRPGAGRKPIDGPRGASISFFLQPKEITELRDFMKKHAIPTRRAFIEEALQLMKERYGDTSTPPGVFRENFGTFLSPGIFYVGFYIKYQIVIRLVRDYI